MKISQEESDQCYAVHTFAVYTNFMRVPFTEENYKEWKDKLESRFNQWRSVIPCLRGYTVKDVAATVSMELIAMGSLLPLVYIKEHFMSQREMNNPNSEGKL